MTRRPAPLPWVSRAGGRTILPSLIYIRTEQPIDEGAASTRFRCEGGPVPLRFSVPTTELRGGHGYRLELHGAFVAEPRPGAPRWGLAVGDDQRFILEIRVALAWHPSATMVAAIRWDPGGEIRQSIGVRSNTWNDRELLLAGGALRFLTDRFCRGGAPPL